jgi:hypothetical protein
MRPETDPSWSLYTETIIELNGNLHGGSTDGHHIENGFVIAVNRETARNLAVAWEQSAFL